MCTLTWRVAAEGGYDLLFNRDERDSRQPELPPRPGQTPEGVRYVAPVDGDHGGTWLLLNTHGLTVALLNHYPRGVVETGPESRGALPLRLAGCACIQEVVVWLRGAPLERYAPFHLVAVAATGEAVHVRWDGRDLAEVPPAFFLTSSSFEPERVQAVRAAGFAALTDLSLATLTRFHQRHDPAAGAESVCMRRPDACTRSLCTVRVRPGERELAYQPVLWSGAEWPSPLTFCL